MNTQERREVYDFAVLAIRRAARAETALADIRAILLLAHDTPDRTLERVSTVTDRYYEVPRDA